MKNLEEITYNSLEKAGARNSLAVVAFSGGPDSTALIHACAACRESMKLRLAAVWINHRLRPEKELLQERHIVENTAGILAIPLEIIEAEVGSIPGTAREKGIGIEAAAREFRYHALESIASAQGASLILTGHTADDQLETVLMRIFRGSGAAGLSGIPYKRGIILRPFLSVQRTKILGYLAERQALWSTDSSNVSRDFLRNSVRAELLPLLSRLFPGYATALHALSEKSAYDEEALSQIASGLLIVEKSAAGASCSFPIFQESKPALRLRTLYRMASLSGKKDVSYRTLRPLLERFISPHLSISGSDWTILVRDGMLLMHTDGLGKKTEHGWSICFNDVHSLKLPSTRILDHLHMDFLPSESSPGLSMGEIVFPLLVRSRKAGDSIKLARGTKKVESLFNEWNIAHDRRDFIPIVQDRYGILAVLGAFVGGRDRFSSRPSMDNPAPPRYLVIRSSINGF